MLISSEIDSERLVLRSLTESSITSSYLSWMNDVAVLKYLEVRYSPPTSIDELVGYVNKINSDDKNIFLGVFLKKNNAHIGNIKLGPINYHHKRADIGFVIGDKKYWGQGFASESIQTLASYAFETLGLEKLTAGCYDGNIGSAKSLLSAGFVHEATLRSHVVFNDIRVDVLLFGKVLS